MPGNIIGGKRAAQTNMERYGRDFYRQIGSRGGKKGTTGGFAKDIVCEDLSCPYDKTNHYTKQCAGYKGGVKSRRKKQV